MAKTKISHLNAILAVLAGILILIWPQSLSIAVGLWLIIYGILYLLDK